MSTPLFRIGARGSPLSRAQVARVIARMAEGFEIDAERIEFIPVTTSGDRIQDRALIEAGGKGLFTKELDEMLLDRRIDLAVHSMKDLPAALPDGIAIAAVPEREDARDAFVSYVATSLRELPDNSVVGTSSVRRRAYVLFAGFDRLRVEVLRGNVETRLKKVEDGVVDAAILALAGLNRLGLQHHAMSILDPEECMPAPCQGALAITTREGDCTRFAALSDQGALIETSAERAFLAALDGSCRTPVGAYSKLSGDQFTFSAQLLHPEGLADWRPGETVSLGADPAASAAALGDSIGRTVREIAMEEAIL